jgi:hypothetical protein
LRLLLSHVSADICETVADGLVTICLRSGLRRRGKVEIIKLLDHFDVVRIKPGSGVADESIDIRPFDRVRTGETAGLSSPDPRPCSPDVVQRQREWRSGKIGFKLGNDIDASLADGPLQPAF